MVADLCRRQRLETETDGRGLRAGLIVGCPARPGARVNRSSPGARLRAVAAGMLVTVPKAAHSGKIKVLLGGGRYTSSYGPIYVFRHALHPPLPPTPVLQLTGAVSGTAFDGQGMWIWYLSKSDGGELDAIAAHAHAAGISTVFVKSSDGSTNYWSQF